MKEQVNLNFLGRFEVVSARQPRGPIAKKAQSLLAYLAVENAGPKTREHLAALLWGETGDDRARHNLRQTLSNIKQYCGAVIASNGQYLELDRNVCSSDIAEFLNGIESDDPTRLFSCLEHYKGDLLEGIQINAPAFEDWLRDTRQRLHESACTIIDRLSEVLLEEGRSEEAEGVVRKRLQMDPACESAHRALMNMLARRGHRSEAIRQYQICVDALERELGVKPEAATLAMYEEIRTGGHSEECGQNVQYEPPEPGESSPIIAVLPFDNLSGEDDLYFADGITEDMTTALSRFHDLQVIARDSSFVYRGNDVPEYEAAAALGANYLVRGSVRRSNAAVRINVQLLDIENKRTIWGEQYNRQLEDVFAVQNDIVSTLVATLVGRVETARLKQARSVPVERLEAYDIMLRGKYHHHLFTAEDCQACIDCFELAIQREPNYAIAHAWLACGYGQAMVHNLGGIAELVDKAQAAAERGLELDEDESECHRVLAQVYLTRGNLRRALWHQERALFLNPNDDRSICAMGELLTFAGQAAEGEIWVRKSLKLNPYHPQRYWSHLARALVHLERYSEALDILDRIGRPRSDDLVYGIVASTKLGDKRLTQKALDTLRSALPGFDAEVFAKTLPYERAEDSELILDALRSVL